MNQQLTIDSLTGVHFAALLLLLKDPWSDVQRNRLKLFARLKLVTQGPSDPKGRRSWPLTQLGMDALAKSPPPPVREVRPVAHGGLVKVHDDMAPRGCRRSGAP